MIGYQLGAPVMLKLGAYQFSIKTAAYQEFSRSTEYRWPQQDVYGKQPALQFTGPGSETITLSGTIYTEYRGGLGQIESMRSEAGKGQPLAMINGYGGNMGRWVIEGIEEKQATFAAFGRPRKQDFTVKLKRYPDEAPGAENLVTAVAAAANGAAAVAAKQTAAATAPQSAIAEFADKAAGNIRTAVTTAQSALAAVQAKAAEIGNAVGPVIATVQRTVNTANALRSSVENMRNSLGNLNSLANIQSAFFSVQGAASAAANAGALASEGAGALGLDLSAPGIDPELAQVMKDCQGACSRVSVTATTAYADANRLGRSISEGLA
jgi:phage protein U